MNVAHYMAKYNLYMSARNLGIRLGTRDIDIDSINAFNVIGAKLYEIQQAQDKVDAERKPKPRGAKRGSHR